MSLAHHSLNNRVEVKATRSSVLLMKINVKSSLASHKYSLPTKSPNKANLPNQTLPCRTQVVLPGAEAEDIMLSVG